MARNYFRLATFGQTKAIASILLAAERASSIRITPKTFQMMLSQGELIEPEEFLFLFAAGLESRLRIACKPGEKKMKEMVQDEDNVVLKNVLQYDPNVTSQVKNIAQIYSHSTPTITSRETIKKITLDIKAKKYFSFTEANSENIDTSKFNINFAVPLDLRFSSS